MNINKNADGDDYLSLKDESGRERIILEAHEQRPYIKILGLKESAITIEIDGDNARILLSRFDGNPGVSMSVDGLSSNIWVYGKAGDPPSIQLNYDEEKNATNIKIISEGETITIPPFPVVYTD